MVDGQKSAIKSGGNEQDCRYPYCTYEFPRVQTTTETLLPKQPRIEEGTMSSAPPVVSLSRPSLRRRLESYYSLIAPDAVADQEKWKENFEIIYNKYGGTVEGETKLATKLAKKYGNKVMLLVAPPHRSLQRQMKGFVSNTEARQASNKHDESHYEIDESRRRSKVLDFTSARFDAIYALDAPIEEVMASNPTIFSRAKNPKRLDNVSKFRFDLPECDPQRLDPSISRNISVSTKCNESKPNIDGEPKMRKISMFLSMSSQYENKSSGPLSLLYSIVANRQRARVMVRYVDCIRGTLTGYLLAFDKHFNMLLKDVEEVYSGRISRHSEAVEISSNTNDDCKFGRAPSKSKLEAQRRKCYPLDGSGGPGPAIKQRYFHQLLIRGDNVVMVWRAESERSNHPRTNMSPTHSLYANTDQASSVGTPGSLYYALKRWENQHGQKRNG
jgi:small nuclear ribonucleoprotein (snRNP)-like protein